MQDFLVLIGIITGSTNKKIGNLQLQLIHDIYFRLTLRKHTMTKTCLNSPTY